MEAVPADLAAEKPKSQLGKQLIGVVLAVVFLWLAFKDTDIGQLWQQMQHLNPLYLVLVGVSGILSHVLRAARWVILLEPVAGRKVSLWNSFCAVMYGYAVNIVIPRGGEVARLLAITKTEKVPWAGVLPTMFIDRLLDIALLVLLLGVTLTSIPEDVRATMPWLVPGGLTLCALTVIGLFMLPHVGNIIKWALNLQIVREKLPQRFHDLLSGLSEQFTAGTRSLTNPIGFPAIAILSLLIWVCYWYNLYGMVWAFDLQSKISIQQSLIVFTIGSLGVLVPTPGSVGSYHLLVSKGLTMIGQVPEVQALAFATVLHFVCFIVLTAVPAAVCAALQPKASAPVESATTAD